ncbi:MAG: LacI family DNA-binding transcriptional regulator [Clostridia bacterium]|nr:LacI family DNA-binding transcriptional regulator [Oscillospiraceae bacterium]MBQ7033911.1 LacI family DNA-binding transcriptional regulator [Clostridia bacterium]
MNTNELAKKCNISVSAVYKALYHKRGVDAKTREKVFAAADTVPIAMAGGKPSVGVVLPARPTYYWDALYQGIQSELPAEIDVHFAFFPSLGSGNVSGHAIDYVQNLDLCIIAPSFAPAVQAKIAALAMEKPIIYVSEGLPTPHLAAVCGNHFDDGYRLGTALTSVFPEKKRILALHVHNGLGAQMRTNGFVRAVSKAGATIVGNIELEDISAPLASVIARAIKADYIGRFDCLYCATGVTHYTCLALHKLKLTDDIICIGYENPRANSAYIESGRIRLLSVSNAFEMGRTAAKIATAKLLRNVDPPEETVYIPSKIFENK